MRKKEIWLYGNFHMGRSGENASGTKKMSKMYGTKKRPEPNIFW